MYRPPPTWQLWASLGGALLILFTAVVIAGIKTPPPPPEDVSNIPEAVSAVLEQEPAPPEPTPPPEEPDIPPPPPPPEAQPEFQEEQPTPPPQPRPKSSRPPTQPIKRVTSGAAGPVSMSSAKAQALFSPRPQYPFEARRTHQTGNGTCVLTVDAGGNVSDAEMSTSTGSPILDSATISAFKRWRFRPGVFTKVRVPITYTMSGAQF